MAKVAPPTNKAAARPICANLVMILSKPICPTERTTDWPWLFPKVLSNLFKRWVRGDEVEQIEEEEDRSAVRRVLDDA